MIEDIKQAMQDKKYAGVTSTFVSISMIDYLLNEIERLDSMVIELRTKLEIKKYEEDRSYRTVY